MNDSSIVQPYQMKSLREMAEEPKVNLTSPLNPPQLRDSPPSNWLLSLFGCCKPEVPPPDFQDCFICNRRTYRNPPKKIEEEDKPYMSETRMKAREKQPIVIYYDRLTG